MSNKHMLRKELRLAGASKSERAGLVEVAGQLSRLNKRPSPAAAEPWWRARLLPAGLASIAGLFIGAALIAYAQTSLPGSVSYPVKRLSEQAAVAFDPNYRATVMMRRSQEVRELVKQRASQHIVLATLADYRTEAAAYKTTNYAAFEYCRSNLAQAASIAPNNERSAITNTLSSLQS
jgi:hypothetical protein